MNNSSITRFHKQPKRSTINWQTIHRKHNKKKNSNQSLIKKTSKPTTLDHIRKTAETLNPSNFNFAPRQQEQDETVRQFATTLRGFRPLIDWVHFASSWEAFTPTQHIPRPESQRHCPSSIFRGKSPGWSGKPWGIASIIYFIMWWARRELKRSQVLEWLFN